MGELLGLSWDNYKESITGHLKSLIQDEEFVDVSLHCEGKTLKAHKVYLSACSEYFKIVLKGTNLWQHPILFLNEIPFSDLQKILEFVYCGEVQLQQKRLTSFLKSAEILKIKGLNNDVNNHVTSNIDQSVDEHNFVRRKKRRKASDENSRTIDDNFGSNQVNNKDFETVKHEVNNDDISECEQVVVKADPEDFQTNEEEHNFVNNFNVTQNDESSANRGIVIRNDLMNPEANLSQGYHVALNYKLCSLC